MTNKQTNTKNLMDSDKSSFFIQAHDTVSLLDLLRTVPWTAEAIETGSLQCDTIRM